MEADDPTADELGRPLIRDDLVFDADEQRPASMTPMPRAVQAVEDRDTEDVWAELG